MRQSRRRGGLQLLKNALAALRVASRASMALSSRAISCLSVSIRSASSGAERSSRSCPISWTGGFGR
jgi:hypothetical protein